MLQSNDANVWVGSAEMDHALCERRVLNVEDEERTYYRERPSGAAKDESVRLKSGQAERQCRAGDTLPAKSDCSCSDDA